MEYPIIRCVPSAAEMVLMEHSHSQSYIASNVEKHSTLCQTANQENSVLTTVAQFGGTTIRKRSIEKQSTALPVRTVEKTLLLMATANENTALTPATLQTATVRIAVLMNNNYRVNLEQYLTSMYQAKRLLLSGIVSEEDFQKIDTIIAEKYGISSCSIYRGYDLIISALRGKISHNEEVK